MDRRVLSLIVVAACGGRREAPPAASDAGVTPEVVAPPRAEVEPDAAPEEGLPPKPLAVLSGAAAEVIIAESVTPREAPPPDPDDPELRISPMGVGKLVLGMSRREVRAELGRRLWITRLRTPPGEVSVELGELRLAGGLRPVLLRIYGGRLTEITVAARDPRARTNRNIGVGSTFEEAILAHGDPRRVPRGYVLEDLPGVIFVPEVSARGGAAPPPQARIVAIIVVGPESD